MVDLDDSPSDDVEYERRGGKPERITKDLINKDGLDALLVKQDNEDENENENEGKKKMVNVNKDNL